MNLPTTFQLWTRAERGLYAHMSDLQANGKVRFSPELDTHLITLDTGSLLRLDAMNRHEDREGMLTDWTAGVNGTTYTIFND